MPGWKCDTYFLSGERLQLESGWSNHAKYHGDIGRDVPCDGNECRWLYGFLFGHHRDGKFRSDSHDHRGRTNDLLSGRKRYTDCFSRQQLSLESRWSNKPKHHGQRCRQLCSNRYECLRLFGDLCGDNCFGYPAGNRIHHCQWPYHLLSGRIGYLERVFRHVLPLESGW